MPAEEELKSRRIAALKASILAGGKPIALYVAPLIPGTARWMVAQDLKERLNDGEAKQEESC